MCFIYCGDEILCSISIFAGQEPTNSFFQRLHPCSSPFFSHGLVPMMQWFLLLPGPAQHGQDMAWRETPRQLCSQLRKHQRGLDRSMLVWYPELTIYIYIFIYLCIYFFLIYRWTSYARDMGILALVPSFQEQRCSKLNPMVYTLHTHNFDKVPSVILTIFHYIQSPPWPRGILTELWKKNTIKIRDTLRFRWHSYLEYDQFLDELWWIA